MIGHDHKDYNSDLKCRIWSNAQICTSWEYYQT